MRIARIFNFVHTFAIIFFYFAPRIFEQGNQNLCFDLTHTEVSILYLPQLVVFGTWTFLVLDDTKFLMKYYDPISFILRTISCGLLLWPSVEIYNSCKAEIYDLVAYKPTWLTVIYVCCILIEYILYLFRSRERQQQVEGNVDEIVVFDV